MAHATEVLWESFDRKHGGFGGAPKFPPPATLSFLLAYYRQGASAELDRYSQRALRRVWQSVRFSWWMTSLLHHFPGDDAFSTRIRERELDYVFSSTAAQAVLAENYVGLPL